MTRILNVNLKRFMGTKYERIAKTLALWAILLFALKSSGVRIEISPTVIWLTTTVLTIGGFIQVLSSDDTIDSLYGQIMLPENPLKFHFAFFLSVALYTLFTKVGLLLVVYVAVSEFQVLTIIGAILLFFVSGIVTYLLDFHTDKKVTKYRYVKHTRSNFALYLLRYLLNNKKYLANTAALWAFGSVFAIVAGKSAPSDFLPIGFALMCLNTPLGILLSSDRALYRQIKLLPRQFNGVLLPYALFLVIINMIACSVYLIVWKIVVGNFSLIVLLFAVNFSIISAGLTVMLEIKVPLLGWKVESDLWHHPRKYIVPGIMIFLAILLVILMGGF
ncbi:hypothetical protein J5K73_002389 [Enterococcus faecium]|nr:hypothetical protein [Enterococcus faecium]